MTLNEWAQRWNISPVAISELVTMALPDQQPLSSTEGAAQQDIRIEASKIGAAMWRNNNGATKTDDGRHLRFGLGNDSAKINKAFKSSDLIGITPMIVQPYHVGKTVGIFTAVEVKRGNWIWSGTERETAQFKFLQLVKSKGGFSTFAKSKEDYLRCLNINA